MEWIEISLLGLDLSCLALTALRRSGYQQTSADNMILPYLYCDRYPLESSTGAVACMYVFFLVGMIMPTYNLQIPMVLTKHF